MPLYNYVARDNSGKRITGTLFALSEENLREKLSYLKYILVSAKEELVHGGKNVTRLKMSKVINFTLNLAALLKGGLPLMESLQTMARDCEDEDSSSVMLNMKDYIESGGSFEEALGLYPKTFSKMYKSTVSGGEKTGRLPTVLEEVGNYLEWQLDLIAKLREAATYPIVVFLVMIVVMCILVGVVLPKFAPILKDLGTELPLPTKIVMGASDIFINYWYFLFGGIFLFLFLLKILSTHPKTSVYFDRLKLKLPVIGSLIYQLCISRFSHSMYLCLSCGIPLIETLELGEEVMGNSVLASAVSKTRKVVIAGGSLSVGFSLAKAFPFFLVRMVEVGENSGNLADGFKKTYEFLDKQIPRIVQRMFTILEPLMIVFMGVVIGGIAVSVFLPLIRVAQLIGD